MLNWTGVKKICRYCDIPIDSCDDPHYKFELTDQSLVDELMYKEKRDMLTQLSYYCLSVPRALKDIETGELNPTDENGIPLTPNQRGYLLPSDILHSN